MSRGESECFHWVRVDAYDSLSTIGYRLNLWPLPFKRLLVVQKSSHSENCLQ